MFSGGDYHEVARWVENFVTSHAKREDLRAECVLDTKAPREGTSYGVRVKVADGLSPEVELQYADVASNRGGLVWCQALADRVRDLVRDAAGRGSLRPA
jgi:hypothetical protein